MTVALATVALVAVALGALLRILLTRGEQTPGRHRESGRR